MPAGDRFRTDEACRAIAAELRMFQLLAEKLTARAHDDIQRPLLESFLLHVRALRDFFFHEGHRSEDLVAAQFVPNWKLIRPASTRYLHSQKQRLDKSLGRLTVQRLRWMDAEWDIPAIRDELGALIDLFRANLAPELKQRFEQAELEVQNVTSR